MWQGIVESIFTAMAATWSMEAREQAVAIPGVGLEGDRYALKQGTFFKPEPAFELTLIEAEAIEALRRDYNVELAPGEARRNIVTRGVGLNHLVGKEFRIGTVLVHGIRLCEPCGHLQKLTGKQLIEGLRHRGGLRAQIVTEGIIHVGDAVTPTMRSQRFIGAQDSKAARLVCPDPASTSLGSGFFPGES